MLFAAAAIVLARLTKHKGNVKGDMANQGTMVPRIAQEAPKTALSMPIGQSAMSSHVSATGLSSLAKSQNNNNKQQTFFLPSFLRPLIIIRLSLCTHTNLANANFSIKPNTARHPHPSSLCFGFIFGLI